MASVPTFSEFLASCPPGKEEIVNLVVEVYRYAGERSDLYQLSRKDIVIECLSAQCEGERNFEFTNCDGVDDPIKPGMLYHTFLHFQCRNCQKGRKAIAITFTSPSPGSRCCKVTKLAEDPPFGPRVPARVITLVGPDKELFLKGRRSENQGLGIGAFAYYRRVIENQKNRLLDEIIRAAKRLSAPPEKIEALEAAKNETQFSRAIGSVNTAIPNELMINGRNPLTLLHSALSEGLHALTDEECLELATGIREVLFALAERVGLVLKEQAGLDAAVARLTQKKGATEGT